MKRWIGMGILCLSAAANAQTTADRSVQPAPMPPLKMAAPPLPVPLRIQSRLGPDENAFNRLEAARLILRGTPGRQLEKAAFIGVSISPVPPALREQLKLQPGMGLLVDHVDKASPAEAAGIKQFDVLVTLDDQFLINANQFQVLVRSHKPGEEIRLTVIHQGEKTAIPIKLTERELRPLSDAGPWNVGPELRLDIDPNAQFDKVLSLRRFSPSPVTLPAGPRPNRSGMILQTPNSELHANRFELMIKTAAGDSRTVTIHTEDGEAKLTAKDKDGKVIYDGPLADAEAILKALSPDVRRMIENLVRPRPLGDEFPTPSSITRPPQPPAAPPAPKPARQPVPVPAPEPPAHDQPSEPI